jgi:hypothetical protein
MIIILKEFFKLDLKSEIKEIEAGIINFQNLMVLKIEEYKNKRRTMENINEEKKDEELKS